MSTTRKRKRVEGERWQTRNSEHIGHLPQSLSPNWLNPSSSTRYVAARPSPRPAFLAAHSDCRPPPAAAALWADRPHAYDGSGRNVEPVFGNGSRLPQPRLAPSRGRSRSPSTTRRRRHRVVTEATTALYAVEGCPPTACRRLAQRSVRRDHLALATRRGGEKAHRPRHGSPNRQRRRDLSGTGRSSDRGRYHRRYRQRGPIGRAIG